MKRQTQKPVDPSENELWKNKYIKLLEHSNELLDRITELRNEDTLLRMKLHNAQHVESLRQWGYHKTADILEQEYNRCGLLPKKEVATVTNLNNAYGRPSEN